MDVRGQLGRVLGTLRSDSVRIRSVLGAVGVLMTLSAAGVLSGLGLFILMMIQMEALAVVGSALLLSVSTTVFLSCYLWLSP